MKLWNPIVCKKSGGDSIGRVGGCAEQSADRGYYLFFIGSGQEDCNFCGISLPFPNGLRPQTSRYDTKCKMFSSYLCNAVPLRWVLQARPPFPALSRAAKQRTPFNILCLAICRYQLCSIKFLHMVLFHESVL